MKIAKTVELRDPPHKGDTSPGVNQKKANRPFDVWVIAEDGTETVLGTSDSGFAENGDPWIQMPLGFVNDRRTK